MAESAARIDEELVDYEEEEETVQDKQQDEKDVKK